LLDPAPRVALVGGEERGTWMLEHHLASARSFAFAALLTREPAGAAGRVVFTPGPGGTGLLPAAVSEHGQDARATTDDPGPSLEDFTHALADRHSLSWGGAGGTWTLAWS
jgi:hypothetical protein